MSAEEALREERDNARYVANYMAGRVLLWRKEAFRLSAKTGEPLEVSAGVPDKDLMAEALQSLAPKD